MTIKQQGGIFGRNPTYNDVTFSATAPFTVVSGDALVLTITYRTTA